jgi:hypothetical protein
MTLVKEHYKFIIAVISAIAVAVQSALSDDVLTNAEQVQIAIAGFTAISVYITSNALSGVWAYTKAISAGFLAALALIAGYLANGNEMTTSMWINVGVAFVTALLVRQVPNEDPEPEPV